MSATTTRIRGLKAKPELRTTRISAGRSVSNLARQLGRKPGTYSNIEARRRKAGLELARAIADALDAELADLFEGVPART